MTQFTKGDGTTAYFLLEFARFLANEGTGVTIAAINSFTLISGDAVLGTSTRAPIITDAGTNILFWCSGGTANTSTIWEVTYTTSVGSVFDRRAKISITHSQQ